MYRVSWLYITIILPCIYSHGVMNVPCISVIPIVNMTCSVASPRVMFSLSTFCTVCSFVPCSPLRHECDVLYYVFIGCVSPYYMSPYTIATFPPYLYIMCSIVCFAYTCSVVFFSRKFMINLNFRYVC